MLGPEKQVNITHMVCHSGEQKLLNCFALVSYIPDPLGRFLDDLRRKLVPGCKPHAHVTILPPRPIKGSIETASWEISRRIQDFGPFEIKLSDIEIFPVTDVVYVSIGGGLDSLLEMHEGLNEGVVQFKEPFAYHPHITLAQELPAGTAPQIAAEAQRCWEEYSGDRSFDVETLWFVQNTSTKDWIDLSHHSLVAVPSVL